MKTSEAKTTPQTIDEYLESAPPEARPTLIQIRKIIREVAPEAVEAISYQIPTFKLYGSLVAFGAAKNHCGFYVMSASAMEPFQDELKGYDTSKGTIRFPYGKPLPEQLIRKLVMARVEENEAGAVQRIS